MIDTWVGDQQRLIAHIQVQMAGYTKRRADFFERLERLDPRLKDLRIPIDQLPNENLVPEKYQGFSIRPVNARDLAKVYASAENQITLNDVIKWLEFYEKLILGQLGSHFQILHSQTSTFVHMLTPVYDQLDMAANSIRLGIHILNHCPEFA